MIIVVIGLVALFSFFIPRLGLARSWFDMLYARYWAGIVILALILILHFQGRW